MNRNFIRRNITSISILLFATIYGIIVLSKPGFMYNKDGSLRQFGIGYQKKTILPAWLIAIVIAIISYFGVLYYISLPKMLM
uniref:Uncharacterized protein n=1 Tax=viral metagenome TaxID=1070528 RepID=A0A6C0CS05_9ZZZZ